MDIAEPLDYRAGTGGDELNVRYKNGENVMVVLNRPPDAGWKSSKSDGLSNRLPRWIDEQPG